MNVDSEFDCRKALSEALTKLSKRLIASELEDFELDKTSEFHLNVKLGEYNQHAAAILLGTYEVLFHPSSSLSNYFAII